MSLYDKQCSFTLRSASCPLGAYQVQITLQFCALETPWPPPITFAASSPTCCLAYHTQPEPLAGSLPLVDVQLAKGAGLP